MDALPTPGMMNAYFEREMGMNKEIIDSLAQRISSNFEEGGALDTNLLVTNPGMGAHASVIEAAQRVASASGQGFVDLRAVHANNAERAGLAFLELSANDLSAALEDGAQLKLLGEFTNSVLIVDFKGASPAAKNVGLAFAAQRQFNGVDLGSTSLFISETPAEVEKLADIFANPKNKINVFFFQPNLQDRLSTALADRRKVFEVEAGSATPKM